MDKNWVKIKEIAEKNNGYIKTSQIQECGISRPMIKKYVDLHKLEMVRKGLYTLVGELPDEYLLIQVQSSKAIFSYGTALYLWEMSDRTPHYIDITIPRGTNISRLKKDNPSLRCHYVERDNYCIGITEVQSPQGGTVKLYDRERCICDLIKNKDQVDLQLYTQAIKDYFGNKLDYRKLLNYGKIFQIEDKIRTYMEVLQ